MTLVFTTLLAVLPDLTVEVYAWRRKMILGCLVIQESVKLPFCSNLSLAYYLVL